MQPLHIMASSCVAKNSSARGAGLERMRLNKVSGARKKEEFLFKRCLRTLRMLSFSSMWNYTIYVLFHAGNFMPFPHFRVIVS